MTWKMVYTPATSVASTTRLLGTLHIYLYIYKACFCYIGRDDKNVHHSLPLRAITLWWNTQKCFHVFYLQKLRTYKNYYSLILYYASSCLIIMCFFFCIDELLIWFLLHSLMQVILSHTYSLKKLYCKPWLAILIFPLYFLKYTKWSHYYSRL